MAYVSIGSFYNAGDASSAFRRPDSILLRKEVTISDSWNETTAAAESVGHYTLAVSFWIANPPDLSFLSVHCSNNSPGSFRDFKVLPHVVGAEGPFVLLCVCFYLSTHDDYFMYKAGDSPSLEWVPPPCLGPLSDFSELGIVPGCSGCHYRLAALFDAPSGYKLRIYCSETKTWSTRTLLDPCPGVKIVPEKVLRLGGDSLLWVDFSCGLLACDLSEESPCARFIPLPMPLPDNRSRLKKASEELEAARWLRDVTCVDGVLRFIEIEHLFKEAEKTIDLSDSETLLDSDLIMSLRHRYMDEKDKSRVGWRAMIWTRALRSNGWSKMCDVDANDIMVDESIYLQPETMTRTCNYDLELEEVQSKDVFRNLYFPTLSPGFPTLSPDGDDLLYFRHQKRPIDQNGLVFAVDLGNKTIKAVRAYSFRKPSGYMHAFHLCRLPEYLNMSRGIDFSACVKITEVTSFANGPINKPFCVVGLIFFESRVKTLSQRALAKATHARNEAQDDDISGECPCEEITIKSRKKFQRKFIRLQMDAKMKHARNEGQWVAWNDHAPGIHPFKNNLQCFNKLGHGCHHPNQQQLMCSNGQ